MNTRILVPYRETERHPPYCRALREAGLEPVLAGADSQVSLDGCHGLLLMGGIDVNPALYNEARGGRTDEPDERLDAFESEAVQEALRRELPILAICRGLQLLNVIHGGSLIQHLGPPDRHRVKGGDRSLPVHSVRIEPGTLLSQVAGAQEWQVNSRHHQAVKMLGEGLRVSATDPEDGVIEAIERPDRPFVLAVQWHPEDQVFRHPEQLSLFRSLGSAAGKDRFFVGDSIGR